MLPTVADVLALDVIKRGSPRVLTAADRLDAPVRWVHVIELAEAGHLLRGGEFVLSTGIALPPDPAGLSRYVAGLADAGVSAAAVELGSRYVRELPAALVAAAAAHRLPLIVLERETEFIAVTEAVHAQILAARVAELRAAERLHQVFTELAMAGASAQQVVEQTSALAGAPVMLADLAHRVVACCPSGQELQPLLAGFAGRSRGARVAGRSGYDKATGWLITNVAQFPGRLIIAIAGEPSAADFVLAERAVESLELAALVRAGRGHGEGMLRAAHQELLRELAGPGHIDPADLHARITAVGVPVTGHRLVPVVVSGGADVVDALGAACAADAVSALTGTLRAGRAVGLLALPAGEEPDRALTRLAARLQKVGGGRLTLGTGPAVTTVAEARGALNEADLAVSTAPAPSARFVRLGDLGLAGLLYQLREHPALLEFADRQAGPLLRHDELQGTDLTSVLRCYLASGGNKAEAAQRSGLARPTLYERLRSIEQVLGTRLDSPESRLALHLALLALPR